MNKQNNHFQVKRILLQTLDPLHVGTGGNRLGRVDNSIVREPGTKLPKIPGTALHGAIRQYAAYRYGKPRCAGQGQASKGREGHCGRPTCPICYTFGAISGEQSFSGVVNISDARILLFPVYSMVGPVWVTSPTALQDAGLGNHQMVPDKARWGGSGSDELPTDKPLNLGWLMVEREGRLPSLSWSDGNNIPEQVKKRTVLVSDKLFSQIVNSNLEVRTSVSINPETGAAEDGALFTYEAIPRATILWFDVIVDDFRGAFPSKNMWSDICQELEKNLPDELPDSPVKSEKILHELGYIPKRPSCDNEGHDEDCKKKVIKYWKQVKDAHKMCKNVLQMLEWNTPSDVVSLGLEWAAHLGIGGMGTRGFGRIKQVGCFIAREMDTIKCTDDSNTTTLPAAGEGGAS